MNTEFVKAIGGADTEKVRKAHFVLAGVVDTMNLNPLEQLYLFNGMVDAAIDHIALCYEVNEKSDEAMKSSVDNIIGAIKENLGVGDEEGTGDGR